MIEHPKEEWERFIDDFIEKFSSIGAIEYKIFICGSYSEECFTCLKEIKDDIIEETFRQHLTFFESDFQNTYSENLILKLDILAAYSDEIIMVIEKDIGKYMIGIGFILAKQEYQNKTSLFILKDSPIIQILTPFFQENRNLIYFSDINDMITKILNHLEKETS